MEGDVDFNKTACYGEVGGHDTFKYSFIFMRQSMNVMVSTHTIHTETHKKNKYKTKPHCFSTDM